MFQARRSVKNGLTKRPFEERFDIVPIFIGKSLILIVLVNV